MDYEKAYNEAIEKIRNGLQPLSDGAKISGVTRAFLEEVFPELKESADEKMWKLIKKYAHCNISAMALNADHINRKELETWLEKQGEKKSAWSEDDERIVTALMEGFRYHQLFNPRFGEVPNTEIISWIKSLKERLS